MTSITDFLLARIAEDEWAAWLATKGPWTADHGYINAGTQPVVSGGFDSAGSLDESCRWEDAVHIARHDPVRVLAECEAKRRIVEVHELTSDVYPVSTRQTYGYACAHCGGKSVNENEPVEDVGACDTLMALAAVYADHPDYDEAWRP